MKWKTKEQVNRVLLHNFGNFENTINFRDQEVICMLLIQFYIYNWHVSFCTSEMINKYFPATSNIVSIDFRKELNINSNINSPAIASSLVITMDSFYKLSGSRVYLSSQDLL
jgi:hypothetical protein